MQAHYGIYRNPSLAQATFTIVSKVGHLLPLEAPEAIALACERMLSALSAP